MKDEVKDGFPQFPLSSSTHQKKAPLKQGAKYRLRLTVSESSECVSITFQLRGKRRKADKLLNEFNFGVSTAIRLPLFSSLNGVI